METEKKFKIASFLYEKIGKSISHDCTDLKPDVDLKKLEEI